MLTKESLQRIDQEIAKYPAEQRRSAIMAALAIAQEQLGWLSEEAIQVIAEYLGMEAIAAYEVASFYNMYDLKPVGKYKLTVCTNLPCMLSGAVDAGDYLKGKLGIGFGETTADGKYTLRQGECMGACGDAPVLILNNRRMCCGMLPEQIDRLLEELE